LCVKQSQVGVGGYPDTFLFRILDHLKKSGVHHGFTEPLQMKSLEIFEFIYQPGKKVKLHEGRRSVRRAILTKGDGAHLAA
jgi:hypothetical protein